MRIAIFRLVVVLMSICAASYTSAQSASQPARTLVYKTKIDFSKQVAVELSSDKKKITSYPAPSDIRAELAPVKLRGGYWLSKTNVTPNTAYLAITCEDYSKLRLTRVTVDELYLLIRSKTPMVEIWDCGARGAYSVAQINAMIDKQQLSSKCKCVKLK